ncbi:MAG: alkaline phosphatase family protein [Bacilli bacterium]
MKIPYSPTQSLVNLSNTILARFGAPTHHPVIPTLLSKLQKKDKIVFLLFDGMGQTILRQHLPFYAWLRRKRFMTITSVFPSTTAAATTSFLSQKYPIEIGWLGWAHYFPEHDRFLELFTGRDYLKQAPALSPIETQQTIQYVSIFDQLKAHQPNLNLREVWPDIRPGGSKDLDAWFHQLTIALQTPGPLFTYGYWLDPDKTIHKLGVTPTAVKTIVRDIQTRLKALTTQHPDTMFVVFADHGLVDVSFLSIHEHPDFYQTLIRSFAFEPRAATFFVKPGQSENFVKTFQQYYGKYFHLLIKAEVLSLQLYGQGKPHARIHDFLGDYVAVAHDRYSFTPGLANDSMPKTMKAHHAGMTKKEMLIDLMVING